MKKLKKNFMKERKRSLKFFQKMFNPSIHYDKEYDICLIYFNGKGKNKRDYYSTIEVTSDFRIDFDKKLNIIGIEIENFSEKLKCKVEKEGVK